jgi:hypothetical protein
MPLKLPQTPRLIFKRPRSSEDKKNAPIGFETKDNVAEFCGLGQRSEAKVTGYGTVLHNMTHDTFPNDQLSQ